MYRILFALLICMLGTFVALCFIPASPNAQQFDHHEFPADTIKQAPAGAQRHASTLVVATLYGALTYAFAGAALAIAISPKARTSAITSSFLLVSCLIASTIVIVSVCYWQSVSTEPPYFGGFPRSTAIMLFVVGTVAFGYVILYASNFDWLIMTPDDERRFEELVQARRSRRR